MLYIQPCGGLSILSIRYPELFLTNETGLVLRSFSFGFGGGARKVYGENEKCMAFASLLVNLFVSLLYVAGATQNQSPISMNIGCLCIGITGSYMLRAFETCQAFLFPFYAGTC